MTSAVWQTTVDSPSHVRADAEMLHCVQQDTNVHHDAYAFGNEVIAGAAAPLDGPEGRKPSGPWNDLTQTFSGTT